MSMRAMTSDMKSLAEGMILLFYSYQLHYNHRIISNIAGRVVRDSENENAEWDGRGREGLGPG